MCIRDSADAVKNDGSSIAVVEEPKPDGSKSRKRKRPLSNLGDDDSQDSLLQLLGSLCEFLLQSLAKYMQHVYASHIIRELLQVLSAQPVDDFIVHSRRQQQHGRSYTRQQLQLSRSGLCTSTGCFRKNLHKVCHVIAFEPYDLELHCLHE